MVILYRIVSLTILLGIIVIIHELGHYIAARLMGVRVETFSFGFGKRLFGKKIGDTDFRVSLIPLGGYVKMAGEEDYESKEPKKDEFSAKNRAQKIFILAMGPIMNVVLSFVVLTIIYMSGVDVQKYQTESPIIGFIAKGSPADVSGLKKKDEILLINNKKITNWKDIEWAINANPNDKVKITFLRDGEKKTIDLQIDEFNQLGYSGMFYDFKTKIVEVRKGSSAERAGMKADDVIISIDNEPVNYYNMSKLLLSSVDKQIQIGIIRDEKEMSILLKPAKAIGGNIKTGPLDWKIGMVKKDNKIQIESINLKYDGVIGIVRTVYAPKTKIKISLSESIAKTSAELSNMSLLVFKTIKKMITGSVSAKSLSGPIEIARVSQEVMESGVTNFFMLIAFISLQLGIINLFPIPALDGGHLLIYSIETIIRRDLPPKIKNLLMNFGFLLLIMLMIFVILNDVAKTLPNGWNSILP